MRQLKALLSLTGLLIAVVGGAWALVIVGRPVALLRIDWRHVLVTPDDGTLLLGVLSLIGWGAWLMLTATVVAEVVAVASVGRIRWQVPGTGGWLQPMVAALVLSIAALTVAHVAPHIVASGDTAGPRNSTSERIRTDLPNHVPATTTRHAIPGDVEHSPSAIQRHPTFDHHTSDERTPDHPALGVVVRASDTLRSLAQQHLGDESRWPVIAAANELADPDLILRGQRLVIPDTSDSVEDVPMPLPATGAGGDPTIPTDPDVLFDGDAANDAMASLGPQTVVDPVPGGRGHGNHRGEAIDRTNLDAIDWVAGFGAATAAGLAAAIAGQRRIQLWERPPGRRVPRAKGPAALVGSALLHAAGNSSRDDGPGIIVVGRDLRHDPVTLDVVAAGITEIVAAGPYAEEAAGSHLTAIVTALATTPWAREAHLGISGADRHLMRHLLDDQASWLGDNGDAMVTLEGLAATRCNPGFGMLRTHDATRPWPPAVWVTATPLTGPERDSLERLVHQDVGICAVLFTTQTDEWRGARGVAGFPDRLHEGVLRCTSILVESHELARLSGLDYQPFLINGAAQQAISELMLTSASASYPAAPWWADVRDLAGEAAAAPSVHGNVVVRHPGAGADLPLGPTLNLLGAVELIGARGAEPGRAVKQCLEYCAWIHLNPGRTSAAMTRSLLVAETTRRSNMSRLRSWLGASETGEAYLPDAYSGRIRLHPAVTTDWEQLQLLVSAGVNRTPNTQLVQALELVRGAPLADAAPGQWHWAEEVRTDIVSVIRDIAVVLGDRALVTGDLNLARWACARALLAAPEDELLMCLRIRTEHMANNPTEVQRLVLHLTRAARQLGVDLEEETVLLLQEVMEGRRRMRRV